MLGGLPAVTVAGGMSHIVDWRQVIRETPSKLGILLYGCVYNERKIIIFLHVNIIISDHKYIYSHSELPIIGSIVW